MLYVIAGASLTGKSSIRQRITKKYGISGIDTDTLRTVTNGIRPDLEVGHDKDTITNYRNMREIIRAFIHARSFFNEDYILEGDCINLSDIKDGIKNATIKAIVIGYPEISTDVLADIMKHSDKEHWSRSLDDVQILSKIKDFIHYSTLLREEANELNIPFIDISSDFDTEHNINLIIDQLFRSQNQNFL